MDAAGAMIRWGWRTALVLGAGLAASLSCARHATTPPAARIAGGRIEGRVLCVGLPVRGSVTVAGKVDASRARIEFGTVVDSSGFYRLDLPAGRYVLILEVGNSNTTYAYAASGLRPSSDPPDTLPVNESTSPVRADFLLGSVHAHLAMPPALAGYGGNILLHRRGEQSSYLGSGYVGFGEALIANGALDLSLNDILPGIYKVEVDLGFENSLYAGYGEHLWVPGVRDSAASPEYTVQANQTLEVGGALTSAAASLTGTISGAWQSLGNSFRPGVALYDLAGRLVSGPVPVDDAGNFGFAVYVPVPVNLLVDDGMTRQWFGGASQAQAQVFNLQSGGTVSGANWVQSGLLLEVQGLPQEVEELRFRLFDAATAALVTDWDDGVSGTFIGLSNLRTGTYLLQVEPDSIYGRGNEPWVGQWYDRASSRQNATPIAVTDPGEVVRLPVTLQRGATLSGAAQDTSASARGYVIWLTTAQDSSAWCLSTLRAGPWNFSFQGVPDGAWKLGASRAGPLPVSSTPPAGTIWYPGVAGWSRAGVIQVQGGADLPGLDISLARPR